MDSDRPRVDKDIELGRVGEAPDDTAVGQQMASISYNGTKTVHSVRRDLRGIHVIFITISGVIGSGLYVRSGAMLQAGGPAAVVISYAFLGLVVWAVMMCIAEMLLIWPVSHSLVLFVREFVDDELATVVGVAYWFCYAIGFTALMTAAASEGTYWQTAGLTLFQIFMFYLMPPFLLLAMNCISVKWYGTLEIFGGVLKLVFMLAVAIIMIVINQGVGPGEGTIAGNLWSNANVTLSNGTVVRQGFFDFDQGQFSNWAIPLFIAIQIGAYSFVGIEIPAVVAVEVEMEVTKAGQLGPQGPATDALRFSTTVLPFWIIVAYMTMGILASLNIAWTDPCLPSQIWQVGSGSNSSLSAAYNTTSVFVCSAMNSGIPALPSIITVFLIFTAWSSANTALYVASRTLFGMTRDMTRSTAVWWIRKPLNALRWLGETSDGKHVPVRALVFSTAIFIWVPFLHLANGQGVDITLNVLAEIGSVCCVLVWACECYAFLRFYQILQNHEKQIRVHPDMPFLRRKRPQEGDDNFNSHPYPWRSPWQPYLAMFALSGCVVILVVINGATLWQGWQAAGFAASYIAPICFVFLWLALKFARYGMDWEGWRARQIHLWHQECEPALGRLNAARANRGRIHAGQQFG